MLAGEQEDFEECGWAWFRHSMWSRSSKNNYSKWNISSANASSARSVLLPLQFKDFKHFKRCI